MKQFQKHRAPARRQRHSLLRSTAGLTLVDLVTTLSVVGIVASTAMPHFDKRRANVGTTQRLVIANLRLARSNAVTRNVHYQVEFPSASQMKVERMKVVNNVWQI